MTSRQVRIRGKPKKKVSWRITNIDDWSKYIKQKENKIIRRLETYLKKKEEKWSYKIKKFKNKLLEDKSYRILLIKNCLPYIIIWYLGNKMSYAYTHSRRNGFTGRLMTAINELSMLGVRPMPSVHIRDIVAGFLFVMALKMALYIKTMNRKKYRKGVEYGSAELGTKEDIEPFINRENPDNNLIFSATEQMSLEGRMKDPLLNRNKNVLIVGGSGAGKTRYYCKPNIMQMNCSYVITDPKGSLVEECGKMLKDKGYIVKVINTIDFSKSMKYNPMNYIKSEKDIMKVVDALIEGTSTSSQQGEQFWQDAEKLLYNALIGYVYYEGLDREKNFGYLIRMINEMEVKEDDESFKNAVDFMFESLEEEQPDNYAVLQYKKFKLAAGKTLKSILITVAARLSRFDIKEVREMMSDDELELDMIGEKKTALFIITSDTTKTYNFIATILYSQLFNILCEKADNEHHGRLPVHVHLLMDEFANLNKIPNMEVLISTIRSREISASIILQSLAQLKNTYDKAADIISDNCDSFIFLGGKGRDTLKEISETLGKETIDSYTTSDTKGSSSSSGVNYQKMGRELFTPDELGRLPGDMCVVQIKGVKPFYSKKYDITKHKNYKLLADYDEKNRFIVEDELSTDIKLNGNTVVSNYKLEAFENNNK